MLFAPFLCIQYSTSEPNCQHFLLKYFLESFLESFLVYYLASLLVYYLASLLVYYLASLLVYYVVYIMPVSRDGGKNS